MSLNHFNANSTYDGSRNIEMKPLSYLAGIVWLQVFCAVPRHSTSSQHLLFTPGQLSLTLADE